MRNRWHKLEDMIVKLSEETGLCHSHVYCELIKEEEAQFDRYLMSYEHARMEDSFFYSALGRLRQRYKGGFNG